MFSYCLYTFLRPPSAPSSLCSCVICLNFLPVSFVQRDRFGGRVSLHHGRPLCSPLFSAQIVPFGEFSALPATLCASISFLSSPPLSVFVIRPLTSRGSAPLHAAVRPPVLLSSFHIRLHVSPQDSTSSAGSAELTGIKELDDLSQEIAQLQR